MNKKGQAIIVVVTILAMLFVIGIAFLALAQVERTASLRQLDSIRARYVAEAGIVYAQKILNLDKQTNPIDSLQDLTFQHFKGQDADLDGDGKNESRGFNLADSQGNPFGSFSLKVSDEASRINLNTCEIQALERLFSQLGIDSGKANTIISRRPFNALEQIDSILGKKEFALSQDFLTVYSQDPEIDLENRRRAYLNSNSSQVVWEAFLAAGVSEPYQKAANLKDASDTDLSQTLMDKFSQTAPPTGLLEAGGWSKIDNFYEAPAGDEPAGKFIWSNLALEDGEYYCFLYGPSDSDVIGEVYLEGEENLAELLFSAERLSKNAVVNAGTLILNIKPHPINTSRFSHLELVSLNPKPGLNRETITGTEALVINEIMVKPSREILIDPVTLSPGEIFSYTFTLEKPGDYYVVVQALTGGGLVGDVYLAGKLGNNLRDGDYFPDTVSVGNSGEMVLEIKNNSLQETSFKGINLLQEPDAEFMELVNLSPNEIALDDFSIEVYTANGELVPGWPGRIPQNTKIEPYQHLVLAVDSNDASPAPENLQGNKISFQGIYKLNAAGLLFAKAIDKSSDLLPNSGSRVILKDALGERIDAVEYQSGGIRDFVSLERPDPSAKIDGDSNGFFDGWYLSESKDLATPAMANENSGMYTPDETGTLVKNSITQLNVFNRPLSGLTETQQLSTGKNWKKFTLLDIIRMADHFASAVIDLDMASHSKGFASEDTGIWEFPQTPSGNYLLSILSDDAGLQGEEIKVGIKTNVTQEVTEWQTLLFSQQVAFYGTVEIPPPYSTLHLEIVTDSAEIISALKKIRLEPVSATPGRVNINTAEPEILRSLFSLENLVETILTNRPLGIKDNRRLGVGDLFLLEPAFIPFYNYLTVKSDVYEIICQGEYSPEQKSIAYQTIRTVVER